ncbi:hypothetical protein Tco_0351391, partial [Tanacetum coccineum]
FPYGTVELSQNSGPNFKVNGHRLKHYFGGDIPAMDISRCPGFLKPLVLAEQISKKRTKNEAKTTKPDTEWKSVEKTKSKEEYRRIAEDQAAKDRYWKIPICYDDDEDYTIAITPVLSTEEPVDSLIMEDEHLDAIPATESDEVIKSSVENLVLIPSESEGIPDKMCDVPLCDHPTPLEAFKEHSEIVVDFNDDSTSSDDDSPYGGDIVYVDASLRGENSSGSTLLVTDYSLPDYEAFYFDDDHIEEKSSGSTTTQSDISLSKYDSFIFDLSNDPFPPADRSDFYHEEFADELAHIISPPEYNCFYFKSEPDPGS